MKAISIPKNKYQAEEERQAKLKCSEIAKIEKLSVSDTSSSKNNDTKVSTRMTNKRNCFKPITGPIVNNVSDLPIRDNYKNELEIRPLKAVITGTKRLSKELIQTQNMTEIDTTSMANDQKSNYYTSSAIDIEEDVRMGRRLSKRYLM